MTTGASTRVLLTACRPVRANFSGSLLPLAVPMKSQGTSVSMPGTEMVKAPLALRFATVLWSSSRFRATMFSAQMPPQAMAMESTLSSSL